MSHVVATREQAVDFMADYPGFGEMRHYADALGCEQVAFSWRQMPPDTGGRGSYGHRHPGQEEIYFVVAGTLTFKVGDDVFEAGPQTAVRMTGDAFYSVHNDSGDDAELVIMSTRLEFHCWRPYWTSLMPLPQATCPASGLALPPAARSVAPAIGSAGRSMWQAVSPRRPVPGLCWSPSPRVTRSPTQRASNGHRRARGASKASRTR